MDDDMRPVLNQLNLVVQDMDATVAFYRRLGLAIDTEPGAQHAATTLPTGMVVEFDSTDFVAHWDAGWGGGTGGSTILGFSLSSRAAVDELYGELTGVGYRGHQRPYDAFWGSRYAIVEDPDGNAVGLMSPADPARNYWPPQRPPPGP